MIVFDKIKKKKATYNVIRKGEIADKQHFLLFPQYIFSKAISVMVIKIGDCMIKGYKLIVSNFQVFHSVHTW